MLMSTIREKMKISYRSIAIKTNTPSITIYSGTPLVRPPLSHHKSGLLRGVASRQG